MSTTEGAIFRAQNETGAVVTGTSIVLTDTAGAKLEPLAFTQSDDVIIGTGYTLYGELKKAEAKEIAKLISTNLEADNLGYGSQGASVNIAGQSASDKGVQELKLTAKNGVWFTTLESKAATNHLQSIQLQSGSEGSFNVGTQKGKSVTSLVTEDFTTAGLTDVREVVANNAGSTAINSFISDAVLSREYNLKDTGVFGSDDVAINYNLSSGRDVLNLAVDQDVMESTDTQININTGAGNDVIHFQVVNGLDGAGKIQVASNTNWLANQQLLNNVKVDAGDGDDQIVMTGAGNAIVMAGTGNDEVRADNTGGRAVFVFNNKTTDIQSLLNDKDTNIASETANQSLSLFKATVKVTFQGFESEAIVIENTNYKTSTLQINQAIKKAIAESPQLSKLLAAHDNEGHALGIESLVDGKLNLDDLNIKITAPAAYKTETAEETAARKAAGQEMLAQDDLLNATKITNPTATTATVTESDLNNAANILNNDVYKAEFGTSGTPQVLQQQTIDFTGISTAPGALNLSGDTAEVTVGTLKVGITAGMSSAQIADQVARALDAQVKAAGTVTLTTGSGKSLDVSDVSVSGNSVVIKGTPTPSASTLAPTAVSVSIAKTGATAAEFLSTRDVFGNVTVSGATDTFVPKGTGEVAGVKTLNFAGMEIGTAGTLAVTLPGNTTPIYVDVAKDDGSLAIAQKVAAKLGSWTGTNGTDAVSVSNVAYVDEKVVLTFTGPVVAGGSVAVGAPTGGTAATIAAGSASLAETATYAAATTTAAGTKSAVFDFAGLQVTESGSFTIAGHTVNLTAGMKPAAIAAAVKAAVDASSPAGTTSAATVATTAVTITLTPSTDATTMPSMTIENGSVGVADTITKAAVTVNTQYKAAAGAGVNHDGKASDVESNNVINLGTGDDLVMMGTGANSNDTLVLTGHNNGTNTVVNYDARAASKGKDFLDFSEYVGKTNGVVVLGAVNQASGNLVDKTVNKISLSAADFAKLSATDALAQLNGTAATDKQVASLKNIDAATGGTTDGRYVLMVENQGNPGEFKVFDLTATAGANAGKFATANTIATLDFGNLNYATEQVLDLKNITTTVKLAASVVESASTGDIVGTGNGHLIIDHTTGLDVVLNKNITIGKLTVDNSATNKVTVSPGKTITVNNLVVDGGEFDVSQATFTLTNTSGTGTITLNSSLRVNIAQAEAIAAAKVDILSETGTASNLIVAVNDSAEQARLDAITTQLNSQLKAGSTAGAAAPSVGSVEAGQDLFDVTAALANTTSTNYVIVDTLANVATYANQAKVYNAKKITLSDVNNEVVTTNSTKVIKFVDGAATLSETQMQTIGTGGASLTDADAITVTEVTAAGVATIAAALTAGTVVNNSIQGKADENLAVTAAELAKLKGFAATGTGNITVTGAITQADLDKLTVADGAITVAETAAKLDGATITGDFAVTVTDLDATLTADLSKITVSGTKTVALGADATLDAAAKLGSFDVNVSTHTLTATAAQLNGLNVTGTGTVNLTAATATELTTANADKFAADLTVNAELAAAAGDLSTQTLTNVDKLDLSVAGVTVIVSEAQALTLTGAATGDTITVKAVTAETAKIAAVNTAIASADATVTVELAAGTVDISAATYANIDKFDLDAGTATDAVAINLTATAAQLTKLVNAGAGDSITVNTLDTATVAATAAKDTFVFAATDTGVTINSFTTGTDQVDLTALNLTAGTVAAAGTTIEAGKIYTIIGADAGAADTVGAAATAISNALAGTGSLVDAADDDVAYFTVVDNNSSAIFKYTATTSESDVTASELTLVGTFDALITAADFGA